MQTNKVQIRRFLIFRYGRKGKKKGNLNIIFFSYQLFMWNEGRNGFYMILLFLSKVSQFSIKIPETINHEVEDCRRQLYLNFDIEDG